MEIKIEEIHTCSENQPESTFRASQSSIDKYIFSSINSDTREKADLKPKFYIITRLPLTDFNIIFMCSVIILDNPRFLIFYYSQHKVLEFLLVWREDPRLLQSLYWNSILICLFYLCILFSLFSFFV